MTEVTIPVGNIVICDACSGDYTESDAVGGMICGNWAICPTCEPTWREFPKRERPIRPLIPWMTFREFVLGYRGPNAAIKIGPAP